MQRTRIVICTLATTALLVTFAARATAQPAARPDMKDSTPVILTIEGGGSLGVYEGGLTWAIVELFRRQRAVVNGTATNIDSGATAFLTSMPRLVLAATSGASAGTINSLLASVGWCDAGAPVPIEKSDYWLTWVSTGIPQLLPAPHEHVDEPAIFSRTHFDSVLTTLHGKWENTSWQPGCSVELGAAITRLFSQELPIGKVTTARNQRWAGVLTVKSGQGRSGPRFTRPPPAAMLPRLGRVIELQYASDSSVALADVERLVKASSGYPLAFAPLTVPYCDTLLSTGSCVSRRPALFVDGGVFDNGPILLGYGLGMAHMRYQSVNDLKLLFVTADHRRHTGAREDRWIRSIGSSVPRPEGLEAGAILVGNMIPTARQYELQVAQRILEMLAAADTTRLASDQRAQRMLAELDLATSRIRRDSAAEAILRARLAEGEGAAKAVLAVIDTAACFLPSRTCAVPTDTARFLQTLDQRLNALRASSASLESGNVRQQGVAGDRSPIPTVAMPGSAEDGRFTNNRFHPLAGEWMNGFGGLLGFPLRAYDFYVGVYDGLRLVADKMVCGGVPPRADPLGDPTDDEVKARDACVQRSTSSLIDNAPIALSARDRRILRILYEIEYTGATAIHTVAADSADKIEQLTTALAWAMGDRMRPRADSLIAPGSCVNQGVSGGITCSAGMDSTLKHLKNTLGIDALTAKLTQKCNEAEGDKWNCLSDDVFLGFLDRPSSAMSRLLGQMFSRLDETTPRGVGSKSGVVLLSMIYHSTDDKSRVDWEWSDNSFPPNTGTFGEFWRRWFPSAIGGNPGHGGVQMELLTPRWHVNRSFALNFPVRTFVASQFGFVDRHDAHFLLGLTPRLEAKGCRFLSSCGVEVGYWDAPLMHDKQDSWALNHLNVGLSGTFLAKKVRIGLSTVPPFLRKFAAGRPIWTLELNDLSGLTYWFKRLSE